MLNENIIRHYRKAQNMKRGFVPYNHIEYEIHVKVMYFHIRYNGLMESNDQIIKNAIRMYSEL